MRPVMLLIFGLLGCSPGTPPIQVVDLDGNPFELGQTGRVAVVIFTRTDCPIANRYAPEIRRLHDVYSTRGVEFVLVFVDPRQRPEAIRQHLKEYQLPCRGLRDPDHQCVTYCGATTTPEAVVFDRSQTIVYRGRIDDLYADLGQPRAQATTHDLADAIEAALDGRPVAIPRTKAIGCPIADLKK